MFFTSPLYLLLLIPWAAVVAWMVFGRRPAADVPFVALWRGPAAGAPVRRAVRVPPSAILLALLAALLAIVASAGPGYRFYVPGDGPSVTVVVDRGLTMSAPDRLERLADAAASPVVGAFDSGPMRVVTVPGGETREGHRSAWTAAIAPLSPTAADTRAELSATAARALATTGDNALLVLSDLPLDVPADERLVQITPDEPLSDTAIVHVAARAAPRPQVMVKLRRTQGRPADAELFIRTADQTTRHRATFTDAAETTAFADVAGLGPTVDVALAAPDDLPANDRAWLVRRSAWPRIEPRVPLARELERMIAAYAAQRPAGEGSRPVAIVGADAAPATATPAVVVAPPDASAAQPAGDVIVADHPVARDVDWREMLRDAHVSPAPAAWTPVVSVGGAAAVAVRDAPERQVWVGLDPSSPFARTPAYVVFWTNVFDWVGQGGDAFGAETVTPLGDEWRRVTGDDDAPSGTPNGLWPGLYRRDSDGATRALNAPPVEIAPPPETNWRARLEALRLDRNEGVRLAKPLLLAALACLICAAWAWPARAAAGVWRGSAGPAET